MTSFGFSVRDFINGIQLGYSIVAALRDSGGSVSNWKKIESDLEKFKQAIETARTRYTKKLGSTDLDDSTERVLREIIDALGDCGRVTERFFEEMEPYRRAFEDRNVTDKSLGVGSMAKRAIRKTSFVFEKPAAMGALQEELSSALRVYDLKKGELEEIRRERDGRHQSNIFSLLQSNSTVLRQEHERNGQVFATLARAETNTSELLQELQSSARANALSTKEQWEFHEMMKHAIEHIMQYALINQQPERVDSDTQGSCSTEESTTALVQTVFLLPVALVMASFAHLIHLIQHQLPRTIKHDWETWSAMSRTVLIYDAIRRKLVFQLQICSSIVQLHDMIEISFRNSAGYQRVKQRRYLLFDGQTDTTIESDD